MIAAFSDSLSRIRQSLHYDARLIMHGRTRTMFRVREWMLSNTHPRYAKHVILDPFFAKMSSALHPLFEGGMVCMWSRYWYSCRRQVTCWLLRADIIALNHVSRIRWQSSKPVCGLSMMEQARLCAIWPMENWLGTSMNHIQGWMTV